MAYVIAEPCIGTKDNSCVEVCPVDCIHPTPDEPDYDKVEMLYIDPEECIDCDACVEACPVDACFAEDQLPEEWTKYTQINLEYYAGNGGYAAPEIEWLPAGPAAVERAVYRGYDEVTSGFAAVWETWDLFQFEESQVSDLGDSVLWLGRVKMRGGASQVELDQEFAIHSVVRDGKFIRVQAFLSWQAAREAVGLRD